MKRAADAVVFSTGWRRGLLGVGAGAFATLGLPPFSIPAAPFLAFPVLVWLLDGAFADPEASRPKRLWPAFLAGWLFGFGYFLAGLWWLGSALLVDAANFAVFLPFAVLGLPALCALFFGFAGALTRLAWPDSGLRVLSLAAALGLSEYLRGFVLTGFPWNEIGVLAAPVPLLAQSASVVGLSGLTLLSVVIFAAPAVLADEGRRAGLLALAGLLLVAHFGFGTWRLLAHPTQYVDDLTVRIVQPNVPQTLKWDAAEAEAIFRRELELTRGREPDGAEAVPEAMASEEGAEILSLSGDGLGDDAGASAGAPASRTLVVWPETAFPFVLSMRPDALEALAETLRPGETLLAGATRVEPQGEGGGFRAFNSVLAISETGEILAARDKTHLVPFGEYLPFEPLLRATGLTEIVEMPGGFTAGAVRSPFDVEGLPAGLPLICYEAIFAREVREDVAAARPDYLLNVTNDAWFGATPGPYQHLAKARLTAVALGLPMVRAANSGISAVTDPYGRIVAGLGLGETGFVDARLPTPSPDTIFSRYGTVPFWGIFTFFCVATLRSAHGRDR